MLCGPAVQLAVSLARFCAAGRDMMVAVFLAVLDKKDDSDDVGAIGDDKTDKAKGGVALDEVGIEEIRIYKAKMGRWRREVKLAIEDTIFWMCLYISKAIHGPADHFLAFLQLARSPDEVAKKGDTIAQLVCGRASSFIVEIESHLDADWGFCSSFALEAGCELSSVWVLILTLSLHQGATFIRRVQRLLCKLLS